ncbi:hypothetical protein CAPTEDRAFT_200359 [Capitella teleta]|uniref:EGF-like domain-containing protein n=1 Tax=Capitella teleta TaxID=283909 RepID=R7UTI0_CAPTE|nr:hypothetical protein CAPTEDRAFT_200359 [Capitella teleta]|eukprot:ELU09490.1 hypothetical protein CAPTEDRAFT_200359 [Capitella teleta]
MADIRVELVDGTAAQVVTPPPFYQECFNITPAISTEMPGNNGGHRGSLCHDQTYCLNGGTCWEGGPLGRLCNCPGLYGGHRCGEIDLSLLRSMYHKAISMDRCLRDFVGIASDQPGISELKPPENSELENHLTFVLCTDGTTANGQEAVAVIAILMAAVIILLAYIVIKRKREVMYETHAYPCTSHTSIEAGCVNGTASFRQQTSMCSAHVEIIAQDRFVNASSQTDQTDPLPDMSITNECHTRPTCEINNENRHAVPLD